MSCTEARSSFNQPIISMDYDSARKDLHSIT